MNVTMTNQDASISDLRLRLSSVQPEIEKGWKESLFFFLMHPHTSDRTLFHCTIFSFLISVQKTNITKNHAEKQQKKILKKGKKLISHG